MTQIYPQLINVPTTHVKYRMRGQFVSYETLQNIYFIYDYFTVYRATICKLPPEQSPIKTHFGRPKEQPVTR